MKSENKPENSSAIDQKKSLSKFVKMKKKKFKSKKISKSIYETSTRKPKSKSTSIDSNTSQSISNRSIDSNYKYQSQTRSRSSKSGQTTRRQGKPKITSKIISINDSESLPKNLTSKIKHIESLPGAIMVRNEAGMNSAGYFIEPIKLTSTDYSLILKASKKLLSKSESNTNQEKLQLVTKITNLTECSPRFRANLLKNSVKIMRFIGTLKRVPSTVVFMKIYEIFQVIS